MNETSIRVEIENALLPYDLQKLAISSDDRLWSITASVLSKKGDDDDILAIRINAPTISTSFPTHLIINQIEHAAARNDYLLNIRDNGLPEIVLNDWRVVGHEIRFKSWTVGLQLQLDSPVIEVYVSVYVWGLVDNTIELQDSVGEYLKKSSFNDELISCLGIALKEEYLKKYPKPENTFIDDDGDEMAIIEHWQDVPYMPDTILTAYWE